MKKHHSSIKSRQSHRGFTLVETVIAMGIITIMITAFLAAFGPAVQGIRKSISAKEANRLSTTLEYELSVLRFEEKNSTGTAYSTTFEKAFEWIEESGDLDRSHIVLLYQYRGDPKAVREDGTLEPQKDLAKQTPGVDYVLQSVVRRLGDVKVEDELQPGIIEGRVFYVRMKQLIYNAQGELIETTDPTRILDPHQPNDAKDYATYPEASLAFQARFYVLKSSIYTYVNKAFKLDDTNGDGDPDSVGKPIFVRNMAVRR